MTEKTATRIAECPNARGDLAVYRLDPPLTLSALSLTSGEQWNETHEFVVVSTGDDRHLEVAPSDFITSDGEKFGELVKLEYTSHDALRDLGYEVTR